MHTLHMGLFGTSSCALITVAVTVLACGAFFFYCHTRMQQMEIALMKQHHVLSSFISNIETEIRNGSLLMNTGGGLAAAPDHATPEALAAARTLQQTANAKSANSRIEVSEDEDEDTSDDSDSDEGDEIANNTSESDDKVLNDNVCDNVCDNVSDNGHRLKVSELPGNDTNDEIKIVELTSSSSKTGADDIITASDIACAFIEETITPVDVNDLIESDDEEEEDDDSEPEAVYIPVSSSATNSVCNNTLITVSKVLPVAYDSLKVDDLRKTVMEQSLATKEEAKKLKKNELLALLKSVEKQH